VRDSDFNGEQATSAVKHPKQNISNEHSLRIQLKNNFSLPTQSAWELCCGNTDLYLIIILR
jgi:hypothetical protein